MKNARAYCNRNNLFKRIAFDHSVRYTVGVYVCLSSLLIECHELTDNKMSENEIKSRTHFIFELSIFR